MWKSFGYHLRTIALALVLALAVWVSAVTSADPDEVRTYPRPIPLEIIGQDSGLVILSDVPKTINLTLRAPHSVWDEMTSTSISPVRAVLDLSGLSAGEHTVDVQVQVNAQPVRIVSVDPTSVTLTLEALSTKTVPIDVVMTGETAIGYLPGSPTVQPKQAVLSGPKSLVDKVMHVQAVIPLNGARQDIQTVLGLRMLGANGQTISGLTISPETVTVSLPVTQQGGYRDIAIKVVVRGQVASGYRLTTVSVYPPVLTVFSKDPTLVNNLPGYVETEPLNLDGASQNVETRLGLNLPDGVSIVGDQTVQVQVGVAAIEGSVTLNAIPVEMTGLADNLSAQLSPTNVDVIISGPLPLLDKLSASDVKIVVDLTNLAVGVHQLTPETHITVNDLQIQSINPATIEVTIATPTPTPRP